MKCPLITVIVPIYNTEKYLDKCINSIINQTYINLEIILVDDGSTDNSLNICNEYKKIDKRIVIINKKNGGLSSAKNAGLDVHKGKYVSFIDSDDYVDNNFIEELYNNLINTNSDISLCNYYDTINNIDYPKKSESFVLENNYKYKYLLGKYSIVTVVSWNKLYKEKIFNKLRFETNKKHEDAYIIADILKEAKRISYMLDKCLYHYNRRDNSLSTSYNISSFDNIIAFEKNINIMKENNIKANYNKFNLSIYMELKYILTNMDKKEDNKLIINEYKNKLLKYQKSILKDKKITYKIIVILFTLFPRLFCKIKQIRTKVKRKA